MNLKNLKKSIQKRVEKSAWTLGGLKNFEKIRVELIIYAYLILLSGSLLIYGCFVDIGLKIYTYGLMFGLFLISFLGKSAQFKKMYLLNKLAEGVEINKK